MHLESMHNFQQQSSLAVTVAMKYRMQQTKMKELTEVHNVMK